MGDKTTNSQVATPEQMSQGISRAFGDTMTEEQARKKKELEDQAAQEQAKQQTQGAEPSAWQTVMNMGRDLAAGAQDIAKNPKNAAKMVFGQ